MIAIRCSISTTYLHGIFAESPKNHDTTPLPVTRPTVSDGDIRLAADLVLRSKQPIILVGSQCTLAPNPVNDVRKALETLRIPSSLSGMARGLLGKDSHFQIRQSRTDAIKEADLIILCGAVADFRLNYGRDFKRGTNIVSVNRDKKLAGLVRYILVKKSLATLYLECFIKILGSCHFWFSFFVIQVSVLSECWIVLATNTDSRW